MMLIDNNEMRQALEEELQQNFDHWVPVQNQGLREILAYHMGWEGEGAGERAQGKRIRPMLVLLSAAAAGADWRVALPAAASVEYLHNFSLIHDDIEDQDEKRRGRPTVWAKWGIAKAINAGDLMCMLGLLSLFRLEKTVSLEVSARASQILQETCVDLTRGQHLDLSYESEQILPLESYWPMVGGKTAALLACCTEMGAISAGVDEEQRSSFRDFGWNLGLAFQVVDDWLGIWGDTVVTGKGVGSDLVAGKKSLPILFALQKQGQFHERWMAGSVGDQDVPLLTELLEKEGAKEYTERKADELTAQACVALEKATPDKNEAVMGLSQLTDKLLKRRS